LRNAFSLWENEAQRHRQCITQKNSMSAKDIFHEAVKHGLVKDGWIITQDPLELEWEGVTVKIDLTADRPNYLSG
jgi:hypothetical protein